MTAMESIAPERFPIVPKMQLSESLHSWVARLALANGWEPKRFALEMTSAMPYLAWASSPEEALLERLCTLSGIPTADLRNAGFSRELDWFTFLWREDKDKGDWLLPIHHFEKPSTSTTAICPDCLRSDRHPYYRKAWRLAFITHCPIHRCSLTTTCPECGAGWNPFRKPETSWAVGGPQSLARCSACGFHVLDLPIYSPCTEPPSVQMAIHFQKQLLGACDTEWFELPGYGHVHAAVLFPGLRTLIRLLGLRHGLELRIWLEHETGIEVNTLPETFGYFRRFEDLPALFRARLLAILAWLFEEWPDRIIAALDAVGLSNTFVIEHRARELPFWLSSVFLDPLQQICERLPPGEGLDNRQQAGKPSAKSTRIHYKANHYESLTFVQDHPEWHHDIPQLILAMKDLRLVMERRSEKNLSRFCHDLLRLLSTHEDHRSRVIDPLSLQSYRARQTLGRKFLRSLKTAIRRRIGL